MILSEKLGIFARFHIIAKITGIGHQRNFTIYNWSELSFCEMLEIKHEYLRSRPSRCLSISSVHSTLDFIEILVLISWISHPRIWLLKMNFLWTWFTSLIFWSQKSFQSYAYILLKGTNCKFKASNELHLPMNELLIRRTLIPFLIYLPFVRSTNVFLS